MGDLIIRIINGQIEDMADVFSAEIRSLVKEMLQTDCDLRPSINEILQKPFILRYIKLNLIKQMHMDSNTNPNGNGTESLSDSEEYIDIDNYEEKEGLIKIENISFKKDNANCNNSVCNINKITNFKEPFDDQENFKLNRNAKDDLNLSKNNKNYKNNENDIEKDYNNNYETEKIDINKKNNFSKTQTDSNNREKDFNEQILKTQVPLQQTELLKSASIIKSTSKSNEANESINSMYFKIEKTKKVLEKILGFDDYLNIYTKFKVI